MKTPLGHNRVLGDQNIAPANRHHRVALASWPMRMQGDPRVASLDTLVGHLKTAGYEGTEESAFTFREKFFPGTSQAVTAERVRKTFDKHGLKNFGFAWHFTDEQMRAMSWTKAHEEDLDAQVILGGQYASYQLDIAPAYKNTAGLYREDQDYLRWCADRVRELRELVWSKGLNFYLEVHVDRVTEDPAALCRILEMCDVELNGDMSHYLCRGFTQGKHVENILEHVGHTHVRMAPMYGELSTLLQDPARDWADAGTTWAMFGFMKRALRDGLSSRTFAGETGPMFRVKDPLTLDAKLVPLYRAMARYADASAQGITLKVESPEDLNPFG